MSRSIVRTTRDRAAALARIIEAGESGRPLTPAQVGYRPSILVETIGSIPGNATAQHTVRIAEDSGGVPAASRSTMLVRHCGANTIASGARLMAEYCGQLGYVIQRGGGAPITGEPTYRYFRATEELPSEDLGETNHWEWTAIPSHTGVPWYMRGLPSWCIVADTSSGGEVYTANGVKYRRWFIKTHGMRWKAEGYGAGYAGGQSRLSSPGVLNPDPLDPNVYHLYPYDRWRSGTGFGYWWDSSIAYWGRYGLSNSMPPSTGVVSYWRSFGIYPTYTNQQLVTSSLYPLGPGSIGAPSCRLLNNLSPVSQRKQGRVWLDGVDVTGIVRQTGAIDKVTGYPAGLLGTPIGVSYPNGESNTPVVDGQTVTGEEIWHDQWFALQVTVRDADWLAGVGKGQFVVAALSPFPAHNMAQVAWSYDSAGSNTRKWDLVFDANGPGGVESVQLGLSQEWQQDGSGLVRFHPGEIPSITVIKYGLNAAPRTGRAVYFPEDSGHYDPLWFASGGQLRVGKWDADQSTIFRRVGGQVESMQLGNGERYWLDLEGAGDPTAWDANYSDYPSTITVSPA